MKPMKRKEPIDMKFPDAEGEAFQSREYKIFKREEYQKSLPKSLYEKACNFSKKILNVQPDRQTKERLQKAIEFAHINTTPDGVASLTLLSAFLICFPTLFFMLTRMLFDFPGIDSGYGALILVVALPVVYYIYVYPLHMKKVYEIRAGSDIVTLIIYMTIYMRNNPNLENAVKFAADNIGGIVGDEVKKLLWDVEVGKYNNMEHAITEFTAKWAENKEFTEAVSILITSLRQPGHRRTELLDESIRIVLAGSRETAKHFNQKLKMPVMVVHALGVILPIMGMVLFPIVAVFLGVEATALFIGYDILLPITLYFVISNIMEKRPATFSQIDVSENPDMPPEGKFKMGDKFISAFPIAAVAAVVIISAGILLYLIDPEGILPALVIMGGIVAGFGIYYNLLARQRTGVRDKTRQVESEFSESLFQLGSQISAGTPVELSIEKSMNKIENLKIKELYLRALKNMKNMGMTLEQAFFDRDYGAVRYYPSKLIKSVMKTVVESSKKGVQTAAMTMVSVSTYLKGLHLTQEEVKEELNDTLNSLKFQVYFLSPFISGIIATLAIMIMNILKQLSVKVMAMPSGQSMPFLSLLGDMHVTPFQFVLIVGIYVIETCLILSMFINDIESGSDRVGFQQTAGFALVIGYVFFVLCLAATSMMFGSLVIVGI
jgi:hypothetical protein